MRLVMLASSLLVAGCSAALLSPLAQPGAPTQGPALAAGGEVRVTVKWPLQTQAIPYSATTLELAIESGAQVVASASITRPETGVTLLHVPPGSYTLAAVARRAPGIRVAGGETGVTVVSNRLSQAHLVLVPDHRPSLDFLYPAGGLPGTSIALYGSNLVPPPVSTYSVLVDGRPVPAASTQPPTAHYVVLTELPAWAGATSSIGLSVDGIPAPQTLEYTRYTLDHLVVTPATASIATGSAQAFLAIAYQDAAETQPIPSLTFLWHLEDVQPGPELGAMGTWGTFQAGAATGSATVVAEVGGQRATASIVVEE